ncbi:MAG TPA: hypothetical protein DHV14_01115 [Micrococcales bacterium]|nr:hypothetical protein [Micrococcales bacterium]
MSSGAAVARSPRDLDGRGPPFVAVGGETESHGHRSVSQLVGRDGERAARRRGRVLVARSRCRGRRAAAVGDLGGARP